MDRLSIAALAVRSGTSEAKVLELARLGLITPEKGGGFSPEDASRVRLALAIEGAGVPFQRLAAAAAQGLLSLEFAGRLVADPVDLTERRHGGIPAALGVSAELAARARRAVGLPEPAPGDLAREDDIELLEMVARALRAGLGEEAVLRSLRTFGLAVRRIVETMRELFRTEVEAKLLAEGAPHGEMLRRAAAVRLELQQLGCRSVLLLQRRFLEEAAFANVAARIEEALAAQGGLPTSGGRSVAVAFIDLAGFTSLTEQVGDVVAAEQAARLEELAQEAATERSGRLIKSLGDGVMLTFAAAEDAVACGLALIERAAREGLPPARAGVAAGPVVPRDGDLFGRTVNLTARLAAHARPGELLTTPEVAAAAGRMGVAFRELGAVRLKGLAEPVEVLSAEPGGCRRDAPGP